MGPTRAWGMSADGRAGPDSAQAGRGFAPIIRRRSLQDPFSCRPCLHPPPDHCRASRALLFQAVSPNATSDFSAVVT